MDEPANKLEEIYQLMLEGKTENIAETIHQLRKPEYLRQRNSVTDLLALTW